MRGLRTSSFTRTRLARSADAHAAPRGFQPPSSTTGSRSSRHPRPGMGDRGVRGRGLLPVDSPSPACVIPCAAQKVLISRLFSSSGRQVRFQRKPALACRFSRSLATAMLPIQARGSALSLPATPSYGGRAGLRPDTQRNPFGPLARGPPRRARKLRRNRADQASGSTMASQDDRLLDTASPWSAPEPWLTKTQLAAYLGVSVRWIEYQIRAGMPTLRFGNRAHFKASEVDAWLALREPQNAPRGSEARRTAGPIAGGARALQSGGSGAARWRAPSANAGACPA